MDPITKAILLSWDWKIEVIIVLALAGTIYIRGWALLRRRTGGSRQYNLGGVRRSPWRLTAVWRPIAYLAGLFVIALALLSPIDALGQQLFFMHMIQHLLLIMIAPPLLLIANPMPFMLWGLPGRWRLKVGGVISWGLHRDSRFRSYFRSATNPGIVWLIWVIALISWHDPALYNAALENEWVHNLEHLTFFLASMLFWWHVIGAGPRIHKQFGLIGRTALVVSAIPPNMLTGLSLAMATTAFYSYYTAVPRLWGLDVLVDQQIGGFIMWIPGSMMYIVSALILLYRLLDKEDHKPIMPLEKWGSDEKLAVPGTKK
ncbi:MAG: cytochrome c oxidase assembly protein [Chloroflexi bacterium]|nr:cytochrome c oxidase assembly protein [Chloroflexota bacterium]